MTTARQHSLMIVDDEEGPRQSMRIVFQKDYKVHLARSGEEALDLARNHRIDVMVSDIRMSGMSGIELLEKIKEIDPHTEVIMLTAYETIDTARKALRLGACDYLGKPFDIATIREAVAKAMRIREVSESVSATTDRLHSLSTELENANFREEMARTIGEIYAGVLHDIKNPLTIIAGLVELLEKQLNKASSLSGPALDDARKRLTIISKQVDMSCSISSRYLSLLRTARGGEGRPISLKRALEDLEGLLKYHPSTKPHTLEFVPCQADIFPRINPTDLTQILSNLTVNGLQSTTQPQKVTVTARRLNEPLQLDGKQCDAGVAVCNLEGFLNEGPLAAISVQDQGSGISPEIVERIFEPYFTTKGPREGTGLGLSIVARLVRLCKGLVVLRSEVNKGTCITVYLPATDVIN
jgi:two-component system, sensor histidine kinase and response regulator